MLCPNIKEIKMWKIINNFKIIFTTRDKRYVMFNVPNDFIHWCPKCLPQFRDHTEMPRRRSKPLSSCFPTLNCSWAAHCMLIGLPPHPHSYQIFHVTRSRRWGWTFLILTYIYQYYLFLNYTIVIVKILVLA